MATIKKIFLILAKRAKKKTIIFYGNHQHYFFEGNLKYLFSKCLEDNNHNNYKYYYLCLNRKLADDLSKKKIPFLFWTDKFLKLKNISILSTAKYVIADYDFAELETSQLCYALLNKAKKIQLWHTRPTVKTPISENLKNKKFFKKNSLDYSRQLHRGSYSFLISPMNKEEKQNLAYRGFKFEKEFKCKSLKVQFLKKKKYSTLDYINSTYIFLKKYKNLNKKKILLLPTANYKNYKIKEKNNFSLINNLNFDKIENQIINENMKLFVKLHRLDQKKKIKKYKNIIFIPANLDIYTNLNFFDFYLTDFSSICYDLLALKKPMILCCKKLDKKNYTKNFIKLYDKFNLIKNQNNLYDFLQNPNNFLKKNNFKLSNIKNLDRFINNSKDKSAKNILNNILN